MTRSQVSARRAQASDAALVTSIIAAAFQHDPLWSGAMTRADGGTDHHAAFWRLFVDGAMRHGWTWLTAGGEATSIWIPPGETEMTPSQEEELLSLADRHLGLAADEYRELLARFAAAHPQTEPHYYLTLLGTHPDHRGRGIGMSLLAHDLAAIDEAHMPAYLESSNPVNDERYMTVGFEPLGTIVAPGGRVVVTTMWRSAR